MSELPKRVKWRRRRKRADAARDPTFKSSSDDSDGARMNRSPQAKRRDRLRARAGRKANAKRMRIARGKR